MEVKILEVAEVELMEAEITSFLRCGKIKYNLR